MSQRQNEGDNKTNLRIMQVLLGSASTILSSLFVLASAGMEVRMKVAVLFSPGAGNNIQFHEVGSTLSEKLSNHKVYTCRDFYGKFYMPDAIETGSGAPSDYKKSIIYLVLSLIEYSPDLFICVGGDGLAAYVANALILSGCPIPIMGIAGGTTNVGPIVSVQPENLKWFDPEMLTFSNAGAIRVRNGNNHVGYAFNDAVIGNTFLGTLDGKTTNLSVEALLKKNKKVAEIPTCDITSGRLSILKNDVTAIFSITKPAQIIVSPLEVDKFYGRAITGALCYSAYLPLKAAIGLSNNVLIKMDNNGITTECFTKIEHMLFGPGELVSISGLSEQVHIVLDGNPYLKEDEIVAFEYVPDFINVARPATKTVL